MGDARRHPIFAFVYPLTVRLGERTVGPRRARLLATAQGTVVEIGTGTGVNFPYYPPGVEVTATEVEPGLVRKARRAAARWPSIEVRAASADALPFSDGSIDTVVSTMVLCTVPDLAAALEEIRRVLRPHGRLLFLEHVRSDDPELAHKQDRGERRQMRLAAGCHPNRDTVAAIAAAGFELEPVERFALPGPKLTRPGVSGAARDPSSVADDRAR